MFVEAAFPSVVGLGEEGQRTERAGDFGVSDELFSASSRSRVGDFADFDRPVAVVVVAVLWACGQRFFFGVVHMSTATWDLRHCDVA